MVAHSGRVGELAKAIDEYADLYAARLRCYECRYKLTADLIVLEKIGAQIDRIPGLMNVIKHRGKALVSVD